MADNVMALATGPLLDVYRYGVDHADTPALRAHAATIVDSYLRLMADGISEKSIDSLFVTWRRFGSRGEFIVYALEGQAQARREVSRSSAALRGAIEALPVGRDIRQRLVGLHEQHGEALLRGGLSS